MMFQAILEVSTLTLFGPTARICATCRGGAPRRPGCILSRLTRSCTAI